jgi:parallel beta-helix repeat protein
MQKSERRQIATVLAVTALVLVSVVALLLFNDGRTPHDPISIVGNSEFTQSNGVVGGNGTSKNPYIIEGWDIRAPSKGSGIYIRDTDAFFVVRDVKVHSNRTAWFGICLEYVRNGTFEYIKTTGNWNGIRMDYSSDITITHCSMISNAYGGVEIIRSQNVTVSHNGAGDCTWPLDMWGSSRCTIVDNRFSKGTVDISSTDNTTFSRNVLDDCRLCLRACTSMTIEDNTMDEPPIDVPQTVVPSKDEIHFVRSLLVRGPYAVGDGS